MISLKKIVEKVQHLKALTEIMREGAEDHVRAYESVKGQPRPSGWPTYLFDRNWESNQESTDLIWVSVADNGQVLELEISQRYADELGVPTLVTWNVGGLTEVKDGFDYYYLSTEGLSSVELSVGIGIGYFLIKIGVDEVKSIKSCLNWSEWQYYDMLDTEEREIFMRDYYPHII